MSSAGISFGGLASGLDTQAIISALLAVERVPINAMEGKRTSFRAQKSAFGDLSGLLDTLKDKAKAITGNNNLLQYAATLDTEDYMLATASPNAQAGTYNIKVNQLAANEVRGSSGFADSNTTAVTNGSETLLFDIDGSLEAVALPANATLDDIANAVNGANIGITAQVANVGGSTDPYQLIFSSDTEGSAGSFTMTIDGGGAGSPDLAAKIVDPMNNSALVAGVDAQLEVNGVTYTRPSNSIGDIIQGVALTLKSDSLTSGGSPNSTQLTVGTDTEATSEVIKEFVEAYNKIVDFIGAANVVDEEGRASNPLFGDSTLRSIRSSLRSIVGGIAGGSNPAYQMLAQVGIASDTQGKLTFKQADFDEALIADPGAVEALFADATNGIATQIASRIDSYTDSVDGMIKTRQDGFDRLIKQTDARIVQAERRLDAYELRLTNQFASLESLLTSLQGQGNALSSINNFNGGNQGR